MASPIQMTASNLLRTEGFSGNMGQRYGLIAARSLGSRRLRMTQHCFHQQHLCWRHVQRGVVRNIRSSSSPGAVVSKGFDSSLVEKPDTSLDVGIIHLYRIPFLQESETMELLKKVKAKVSAKIVDILTEQCFNIQLDNPLTPEKLSTLHWLLAETYEPDKLQSRSFLEEEVSRSSCAVIVEVGPRMTFSTAFSTNAVSICKSLSLVEVSRLERSRRYLLRLEPGSGPLDESLLKEFAALVHDRMTECIYPKKLTSFQSDVVPEPVCVVPVIERGEEALEEINVKMGLAFDKQDIDYYTHLFRDDIKRNPTTVELFDIAQSNSEHSRHWFFNGKLVIDGETMPATLFQLVKSPLKANPNNSVIGFKDNSSAIKGFPVNHLRPTIPGSSSPLSIMMRELDILFTAETHNFPCAVAPYPGAETEIGMLVVKIGGPAYRIGMGGGAASSMVSGQNDAELDFNAVQRGDAEMAQKLYRVRCCEECQVEWPPPPSPVEELELEKVLGDMPQKTFKFKRVSHVTEPLDISPEVTLLDALKRVLRLPSVCSKRFLTTKVDRCVTGLVAQQQTVGPLQLPLADVAVIAQTYTDLTGGVCSIGEQPIKGLLNPKAMARLAVGEALTNLVWAKVTSLADVKASGNWMYAAKLDGEGADMYDAAVALADCMIELGIAIDGGKDSLSMAAQCDGELVKAPGNLEKTSDLRDLWEETSFQLEELQRLKSCVKLEKEGLKCRTSPSWSLSFTPKFTDEKLLIASSKPKVAIIREEGSNGDREMAAAFHAAGFEPWDITMSDLLAGKSSLTEFRGIAFVGVFSYADVLDSAKGWAASIRFNKPLVQQFQDFYHRPDTFSLGVCNGCQLMALLGWVPGSDVGGSLGKGGDMSQPRFIHNESGRFECRFTSVSIGDSPAIMFKGMEGSTLGVWSAHGEGRAFFPDENVLATVVKSNLAPVRYCDDFNNITETYPFNPNGSPLGIGALCSPDGRHLAMMPHPERCFMMWQYPWYPKEWQVEKSGPSPWLRMFQNAREWAVSGFSDVVITGVPAIASMDGSHSMTPFFAE
ncbi:unnamed protein product [Miscanthus lutarioriparius]|uniref:phosphoribosylformylglycinamidine synthase n=1 Tax=Miscanthus lutarioriparius TaxID=422564 RepID=A0A811R014_9POAL|nr:unnamed protein product [Miscanthus lutarioriparius]